MAYDTCRLSSAATLSISAMIAGLLLAAPRTAAHSQTLGSQTPPNRAAVVPARHGSNGVMPPVAGLTRWSTAGSVNVADLEHNPSLDAVERYAARHNPEIRAAFEAWKAARYNVTIQRSYDNPMVTYMPDTDNMAQTRAGEQTGGVGFSQTIPFPGKLTVRGRIAARQAEAQRQKLRGVLQEVQRRVWISYAGYYLADRGLEVNTETIKLARQFETIAEAKYKVGQVPEQDVIQSQVELSRLAVQRVDLRKARNTALGNLNTLMDRNPRARLGRPEELTAKPLPTPLDQLVELSRAARPEVKAEDYMVKARENSVTLARMGYLPDFSVGGQYMGVANNGVPGFNKDGHDIWTATFGFSVPIWLDRVKAKLDQANAQLVQEQSNRRNVEDTVADQVQNAYERLVAAARNEAIYRTTLMPQTAQRIAAAQAGYQTGVVDFFTLIDSLTSYENVRLRHYQTIQAYQVAAADLSRAVGQPIKGIAK